MNVFALFEPSLLPSSDLHGQKTDLNIIVMIYYVLTIYVMSWRWRGLLELNLLFLFLSFRVSSPSKFPYIDFIFG